MKKNKINDAGKKNDDNLKNQSFKNIYYMQNRTYILERRIIAFFMALLLIIAGIIVFSRVSDKFYTDEYIVKSDSLNSKYMNSQAQKQNKEASAKASENEVDYTNSIICWGDSFSDNSANSTNFYTYYLSQLLSERSADIDVVFSSGIEGDTVPVIAAKQGGMPMLAQPFVIPAQVKSVEISLKNSLGGTVLIQDKLNSGLNPCTIAGVEGTIDYRGGKLCFTRSKAGKEIKITTPATVVTNVMQNIKGYTAVFFFGGDCTKYNPPELVSMYKEMIKFHNSEKYIIVGSITGDEKTLAPYEEALAKEFKTHYINLRDYLVTNVYNDYEIKISTADAKALRSGAVPPLFILNGKRLTDTGSEILADLLFDKLLQLEIIN